ncbi:hypothetical protein AURDEDRAFT_181233 [Auricularia subglabra TFB-10046 SS5]|nr:hypothetical protein AURDEDRAFT_181233 [Auricularia subglabra TFB-10046 SS5]
MHDYSEPPLAAAVLAQEPAPAPIPEGTTPAPVPESAPAAAVVAVELPTPTSEPQEVASPSDLAVAAAVQQPPVPDTRARRRSLPGFGFWGNKKHAESIARAAISPPTVPQELPAVAEGTDATLDEKGVIDPAPAAPVAPGEQRKRKKSIKKKPRKDKKAKDEAKHTPTASNETEASVTQNGSALAASVSASPSSAPSTLPPNTSSATVAPLPEPTSSAHKEHKPPKHLVKKSEKKADQAAIGVRTLIIGPTDDPTVPKTKPLTKTEVNKLKGLLLEPKSATKIIARLRVLPVPPPPRPGHSGEHSQSPEADVARAALSREHAHTHGHVHAQAASPQGPIHAVCLDCTDAQADQLHFSQLQQTSFIGVPSLALADAASAFPILRNMRIISLLGAPDLGLGQPVGGQGMLAGSLPSPAVIVEGLMQLSQQLIALGFATSTTVHPNHVGVYPPTDRMSVLTYWWGLEVLLPQPSMEYLANVKSVQNAVLNVLTALSMFNSGVREVLPFIRYISQFIDFEWNAIQSQNKGNGVVCAATWVMPAAMVPRPWDFAAPPEGEAPSTEKGAHFEFLPPGPVLPPMPIGDVALPAPGVAALNDAGLAALTPASPATAEVTSVTVSAATNAPSAAPATASPPAPATTVATVTVTA